VNDRGERHVERALGCAIVIIGLAFLLSVALRLTPESFGVILWRRIFG